MRALSAIVLSILLSYQPVQAATDWDGNEKLIGMWSSAELGGAVSIIRRECTAVTWSERKIELRRIPGEIDTVEGQWVKGVWYMWMNTDGGRCRWGPDDSQFGATFYAAWVYTLNGSYDHQRKLLKIHGVFRDCSGSGSSCNTLLPPTARQPFDTELVPANERLVDTNATPDPKDDIQFARVTDEAELVGDANASFLDFAKMLDAGQFERFYDGAATSSFRDSVPKGGFLSTLGEFRNKTGGTTIRKNLKSVYAQYLPSNSKLPGEYVLVINGIETSKGLRGGEFVVLKNEGGVWKVQWINYGS